MMWKEKIMDSVEFVFVVFTSYIISSVIINEMGFQSFEKAYAPALPIQSEPFYKDITA